MQEDKPEAPDLPRKFVDPAKLRKLYYQRNPKLKIKRIASELGVNTRTLLNNINLFIPDARRRNKRKADKSNAATRLNLNKNPLILNPQLLNRIIFELSYCKLSEKEIMNILGIDLKECIERKKSYVKKYSPKKYLRLCKRCGNFCNTETKTSSICFLCNKSSVLYALVEQGLINF